MNTTKRVAYVLLGILAAVIFFVTLGAGNAPDQGRYQIACTSGTVVVADTSTGAVKIVWNGIGQGQLDKPFASMHAAPDVTGR